MMFKLVQEEVRQQIALSPEDLHTEMLMSCLIINATSITCKDLQELRVALLKVGASSLRWVSEQWGMSVDAAQLIQSDVYNRKNRDYGDSYKAAGAVGVVIRMCDKMNRLASLRKNAASVTSESMNDTMLDLSIYAMLAILCLDE